jgi:hypothetical protein
MTIAYEKVMRSEVVFKDMLRTTLENQRLTALLNVEPCR